MTRLKTFLSPHEQWMRTANYWPCRGWANDTADLRRRFEFTDRQDSTIAVVVRAHRWARVGDVLRLSMANGMMKRWAVQGVSSRGFRLKFAYFLLAERQYGVLSWCNLPDELIGKRWDDPAIWQFVQIARDEALAARAAARMRRGVRPDDSIPTNAVE